MVFDIVIVKNKTWVKKKYAAQVKSEIMKCIYQYFKSICIIPVLVWELQLTRSLFCQVKQFV